MILSQIRRLAQPLSEKPSRMIRKGIILLIICLLSATSYGQHSAKWWLNRYKYYAPLMAIGGIADAHVEILTHKPWKFQNRWPSADMNKWDPKKSWRNKWRNGDPSQGERFLGSSTVFVMFTDPYHGLRTVEHVSTTIAGTIPLSGDPVDIKVHVIDFGVGFILKSLFFELTYGGFYGG